MQEMPTHNKSSGHLKRKLFKCPPPHHLLCSSQFGTLVLSACVWLVSVTHLSHSLTEPAGMSASHDIHGKTKCFPSVLERMFSFSILEERKIILYHP